MFGYKGNLGNMEWNWGFPLLVYVLKIRLNVGSCTWQHSFECSISWEQDLLVIECQIDQWTS